MVKRKKDKQCNGQKKKERKDNSRSNTTQNTEDGAQRTHIITITPNMTQNMLIPSTVSETKKMTVLLVHALCDVIFVSQCNY
jgi:hypothetical protein